MSWDAPPPSLRVLLIEDSPDDAVLTERALRQHGYAPDVLRVDRLADLTHALTDQAWDVAIADYVLPGFTALEALRVVEELRPDLPVIVVSGRVGEETAVEAMQHGARDYLMKDRLARLGGAVERALTDSADRRAAGVSRAALAASEQRLRRLLAAVPAAIVVFDEAGTIVTASGDVERILGFRSPELVGRPLRAIVDLPPLAGSETDADVDVAPSEETGIGPAGNGANLAAHAADGSSVPVEVSIGPLETIDGDRRSIAVIVDVTERRALEMQLLRSQKMEALGRLAGSVAHDFNNLLAAIRGLAILARNDSDPLGDLEQIVLATDQGRRMTDQLLGFARPKAISPEAVDLDGAIESLRPVLERLVGERAQLRLELRSSATVPIDRSGIEQVLTNLVVNGADAMTDGGELEIATRFVAPPAGRRTDARPVALTVSDTGSGIPGDLLPHIFEPFFTTKPATQGTGLGLATVYTVVTGAGGSIDVSTKVGRGTRFEIRLPCETRRVGPGLPDSGAGAPDGPGMVDRVRSAREHV